jgi:hypothetical protein
MGNFEDNLTPTEGRKDSRLIKFVGARESRTPVSWSHCGVQGALQE